MKRKAIIAMVALLIASNSVRAQNAGGVVLRYGETISAGYGSANQIITPYVNFPAYRIKAFADGGCSVTAVKIGLAKPATNVTIYLKHNASDRRAFYTQKVGNLDAGWNTVELTTPSAITEGSLTVGYKATFADAGGAGYDNYASAQADTVLVNSNSRWASIDGSFCIQPVVSGGNMPKNYVVIDPLPMSAYTYDTVPDMKFLIRNVGTERVERADFNVYNDEGIFQLFGASALSLDVNETDTMNLADVTYDMGLFYSDYGSQMGTKMGNNSYTLKLTGVNDADSAIYKDADEKVVFSFERRDPRYMRRVVMEDFTGDWCQFCVGGIEEFRYMKNGYEHPEEVIPISIHVPTDPLALADNEYSYKPLLDKVQGFPTVYSNRMDDYVTSQPYGIVRRAVRMIQATAGTLGLEGKAQFNADSTAINITTSLVSENDIATPDFKISYVLLEDSIDGLQYNGYSGGSNGSFMGWENLPQYVEMKYDDVARGVYNTFNGRTYTTESMTAGESVAYSYAMDLTKCPTSNKRNLHVAALVLNSKGEIVNAVNLYPTAADETTGIASVFSKGNAQLDGPVDVYSTNGQHVGTFHSQAAFRSSNMKGLFIVKSANRVIKLLN